MLFICSGKDCPDKVKLAVTTSKNNDILKHSDVMIYINITVGFEAFPGVHCHTLWYFKQSMCVDDISACCRSLRSHCAHRCYCWGQYKNKAHFHGCSSGLGSQYAIPGSQQAFGQNRRDLPAPCSRPSSGASVQRARLDRGSAADEALWTSPCWPGWRKARSATEQKE